MNLPLIAFGFLMTFSSSFGQTHFISLFNSELRESFALSHGSLGAWYSLANLASAATLVWVGKWIDQVDLRYYTTAVMIGLALAAGVMSQLHELWMLVLGFYGLRLFGQGLSGHVGMTTVARYAQVQRGMSLSISGLGFALGEALMPIVVAALLLHWLWPSVWGGVMWVQMLLMLPLAWCLLRGFYRAPKRQAVEASTAEQSDGAWTRAEVLRDPRFWWVVPAVFTPSMLVTGLFFHQQSLAAAKGVAFSTWVLNISAYSLSTVLLSLAAGAWVDRRGARVFMGYLLLPLAFGCMLLAELSGAWVVLLNFALMGATQGLAVPCVAVLWVELYGQTHQGAIRALAHGLSVLAGALGALGVGLLLDGALSWPQILWLSAAWCALATAALLWGLLRSAPSTQTSQLGS